MTTMRLLAFAAVLYAAEAAHTLRLRREMQRRSLRHLMDQYDESLSEILLDPDMMGCSMNIDKESCEMGACEWCPFGDVFGSCVPTDVADLVNVGQIPHVQCGAEPSLEDIQFWDDFMDCAMEGVTGEDCLANPVCTWCTVHEPAFGACVSADYYQELKDFDVDDTIGDYVTCSTSPSVDELALGSITDSTCIIDGNGDMFEDTKELCEQDTKDALGNPCVTNPFMGFMDVCVSSTQSDVIDYFVGQLDEMGLGNPMDLMGMPTEEDPFGDEEAGD